MYSIKEDRVALREKAKNERAVINLIRKEKEREERAYLNFCIDIEKKNAQFRAQYICATSLSGNRNTNLQYVEENHVQVLCMLFW